MDTNTNQVTEQGQTTLPEQVTPTNQQEASVSTSPFAGMSDEQLMAMSDEEYETLANKAYGSDIPQFLEPETGNPNLSTEDLFKPNTQEGSQRN